MSVNRKPFQLPKPIQMDASVLDRLTGQLINRVIDIHEHRIARYRYFEAMYEGFHDIFREPELEEWKPDNRLAVNFPKVLIDTFVGYAYGIPITESHPDEAINDKITDFCRANNMTDHEFELFKSTAIFGHSFEYFYQDERTQTRVTIFNPLELFLVYDNRISNRALFAVRYGYHFDEDGRNTDKRWGDVLTRDEILHFDDGKIRPEETEINPYGYIPVVEYRLNRERSSLIEPITNLTEMYSKALSEKGNDVERFKEAYLKITGHKLDLSNPDVVKALQQAHIINLFNDDPDGVQPDAAFLEKPVADGTQENLLDRLERQIYQTGMVANISDSDFGNAVSGTALAYKLWSTSNLAKTFDRKNTKSIRARYKIFCSLATNCPNPDAWRDIQLTTHRNVPRNLLEETQTAQAAEGVVSKKTQLGLLSYVEDPETEIEQMEKEKQDSMDTVLNKTVFNQTKEADA
jgi:SPP1 family phage portal protein